MTLIQYIKHSTARALLIIAVLPSVTGCAFSYYSEADSTLHVFGLSHIAMRIPEAEPQSVYHQQHSYGLAFGSNREGTQVSLGYTENTVLDIANNESLCFEWPSSKLMQVRIGQNPPQSLGHRCISEDE